MCYNNEFIKEIEINNYDDLVKTIQGKSNKCDDLRDKFIFRGVEDSDFKLIPSALRGDNINDFVDERFNITLWINSENVDEFNSITGNNLEYCEGMLYPVRFNKYLDVLDQDIANQVHSFGEIQFRKELNALMNFLNYTDKSGLKIPIKQETRELIEHDIGKKFNGNSYWPDSDFYEVISLAQHYGIPTRALDWSYDYGVALYFAVKNILADDYLTNDKKPNNAVLWAFNYKYFEVNHMFDASMPFPVQYYRPEYNSNPNLNAQKGLFTFIVDDLHNISKQPFDEFVEDNLSGKLDDFIGFDGSSRVYLPKDEKAFYKFIIPEGIKPEILDELYHECYSEEYLFPGYGGVTKFVENRIKLDKLLNNL